jgi:hypothetical protein
MAKSRASFVPCIPKELPKKLQYEAAIRAISYNPVNRPAMAVRKDRLAVETSKKWPASGVKLTVAFLDNPPVDVQKKIILYMNMWSERANVVFLSSMVDPQVRIARARDGYWSYLGTDIESIPAGQPTMNLEGFSARTPDAEYLRVVVHEAGHTLGFPHEHMRRAIIEKLDPNKTIAWGRTALGWDRRTVIQQILTPLEEDSIMGTPHAEETSIMCYQLPASITKNGQPIKGGDRLTEMDHNFIASIYPLGDSPPPPDGDEEWGVVSSDDDEIVLRRRLVA